MSELHLLQLRLNPQKLYHLAHTRGAFGARLDDAGYLLHQLLTESFGPKQIHNFTLKASARQWTVLAYSGHSFETLLDGPDFAIAEPDTEGVWSLDSSGSKPFPRKHLPWVVGQRYGFEILDVPTRRIKTGARDFKSSKKSIEVDAWLATPEADRPTREDAYRQWLHAQFESHGGATVESVNIAGFHARKLFRKGGRLLTRTEVGFRGVLTVTDSDAFTQLLRRGTGRDRAFGHGMILLRPAS